MEPQTGAARAEDAVAVVTRSRHKGGRPDLARSRAAVGWGKALVSSRPRSPGRVSPFSSPARQGERGAASGVCGTKKRQQPDFFVSLSLSCPSLSWLPASIVLPLLVKGASGLVLLQIKKTGSLSPQGALALSLRENCGCGQHYLLFSLHRPVNYPQGKSSPPPDWPLLANANHCFPLTLKWERSTGPNLPRRRE